MVPDALLLHFAAAELHEAGGDAAAAREVYERLAAPLDGDKDAAAPATPDAKDAAASAAAQVLAQASLLQTCECVLQRCAVPTAADLAGTVSHLKCWKHLHCFLMSPTTAVHENHCVCDFAARACRASRTACSRRRDRWCGCSTSALPSARRACAPPARCDTT